MNSKKTSAPPNRLIGGNQAEHSVNCALGEELEARHPGWQERVWVERTRVIEDNLRLRPDIIVRHPGGLPVVLENEFAPAVKVEEEAISRLGKKLKDTGEDIEQAIALKTPLRIKDSGNLRRALSISRDFEICVLSGDAKNPQRWPEKGWLVVDVDGLAEAIELASLSENRIERSMEILDFAVSQTASILMEASQEAPESLLSIAEELHQESGEQTARMAMAIITNALTFHRAIEKSEGIKTIEELKDKEADVAPGKISDAWRHIYEEINYQPIFKTAASLLKHIPDATARTVLKNLVAVSSKLNALGITSQHDLNGRMFQRLIRDRKFLATFYTLPSSAALLSEVAVSRLGMDWSNDKDICGMRVADFACGTGALLGAAYGSAMSRYRRGGGDDKKIHPCMMENVLVGTDVMPAATHLTASVLSSAHPGTPFKDTSIATLPYGHEAGRPLALGALDLIEEEEVMPLLGSGQQRVRGSSEGSTEGMRLPHGSFDLVIMNPPFTRSTNHEATHRNVVNPAFAPFGTTPDIQTQMGNLLKGIRRRVGMAGSGNAGLASDFLDIAHVKVKQGGVIALVLPAVFLSGDSWKNARSLLRKHYHDITVFSIATAGKTDRAFSADTGMAEVMIVAVRNTKKSRETPLYTYINLHSRPKHILEAVFTARDINDKSSSGETSGLIKLGTEKVVGNWIRGIDGGYAAVRNLDVAKGAAKLYQGLLPLPKPYDELKLPIAQLKTLGSSGPLSRDISEKERNGRFRGPFDVEDMEPSEKPTYPALWAHDAKRETRMIVNPDKQCIPRPECDKRAADLWEKAASRLHFNQEFQLNSQPLSACLTQKITMGGRAWPSFLCKKIEWETPLLLWSNTTLGLIAFWWIGSRQQLGRVAVSRSVRPDLAVLDASLLKDFQISRANDIFHKFKNREFLPANEAYRDEARKALDEAVLIDLLGLPKIILAPLNVLREQWCSEPTVHGGQDTRPA